MDPAMAEELEALKSIYGEDIEWEALDSGSTVVRVSLSGIEVGASWFSTSIEFLLNSRYPNEPPIKVNLRHPRGLHESEIDACTLAARRVFSDQSSDDDVVDGDHHHNDRSMEPRQLLYDAVESVRECLSKRSGLSLPCPICLHGFVPDDSVYVTGECSHHFHTYCLARYVEHARNELHRERALFGRTPVTNKPDEFYCPVCRTVIDTESLNAASNATDENAQQQPKSWTAPDTPGTPNETLSKLSNPIERHYKDLWEKQKRNGGLIDLQREKDRFLVTEHTRVPTTGNRTSATSSSTNS